MQIPMFHDFPWWTHHLHSGKLTVCYWKWSIEIVDLPQKKGDFPESCQFTRGKLFSTAVAAPRCQICAARGTTSTRRSRLRVPGGTRCWERIQPGSCQFPWNRHSIYMKVSIYTAFHHPFHSGDSLVFFFAPHALGLSGLCSLPNGETG